MRTIIVPSKGQDPTGLRQENLAILLKCKDTLLENMRLSDTNIHLKAEIDRLKIIIEFLMRRITKCRCHPR
jgi:hypothetical protein